MELQFKNQFIFFALESIWPTLDYKFKYHINELITANSEEDYVQTVEVPEGTLLHIFRTVSRQPEGVAAFINQEMLAALVPQIMAVSNLEQVNETVPPNEGARLLIAIDELDQQNKSIKANKILNGKTQILEQ